MKKKKKNICPHCGGELRKITKKEKKKFDELEKFSIEHSKEILRKVAGRKPKKKTGWRTYFIKS